jgi:carbonic anhydrase/acetyltransferase-like protein (isoleucine patch superfamily)
MIYKFEDHSPQIASGAWIAPSADIIGRVFLEEESSVWYQSVLRGDNNSILIGRRSNIQDGCVLHVDPHANIEICEDVSVGHRVVLHGCYVGKRSLVGMGAVVMNGVEIGSSCLVAAGSVLLQDTTYPEGTLIAGLPGKVKRELSEEEREFILENSRIYVRLSTEARKSTS